MKLNIPGSSGTGLFCTEDFCTWKGEGKCTSKRTKMCRRTSSVYIRKFSVSISKFAASLSEENYHQEREKKKIEERLRKKHERVN